MKNQYFGDNQDLFTYDLVLQIIWAGLVARFTFIPMLTGPDGTGHGGETDRARARVGTENKELLNFLDGCVKGDRRDIRQLVGFFKQKDIPIAIYHKKFSHAGRAEYFRQIGDGLLSESVILVDPDIGLEVARPDEKHILYSEVDDLYQRMGKNSILMLFQYFPREEHVAYLQRMSQEIADRITGELPVGIDNGKSIFFFLTKDESMEHALTHLISDYAERYSNKN